MKILCLCLTLLASALCFAQTKDEIAVLSNARSLNNAIFKKKDSALLEKLFAAKLTYGHSGGKIESRQEAIRSILSNTSVYDDVELGPTYVAIEGSTAVTRYQLTATETTKEGARQPLKLHILLVWVKEKKDWKLLSRQAVKTTN